jgi:hypothetical protein
MVRLECALCKRIWKRGQLLIWLIGGRKLSQNRFGEYCLPPFPKGIPNLRVHRMNPLPPLRIA